MIGEQLVLLRHFNHEVVSCVFCLRWWIWEFVSKICVGNITRSLSCSVKIGNMLAPNQKQKRNKTDIHIFRKPFVFFCDAAVVLHHRACVNYSLYPPFFSFFLRQLQKIDVKVWIMFNCRKNTGLYFSPLQSVHLHVRSSQTVELSRNDCTIYILPQVLHPLGFC